ncbi:MAG: DMT family transporter [Pseudomonadota bacterium]
MSSAHVTAILWVLLSTALFTVVFAAAKFGDGAIGTFQILVLRYVGAFLTLLVIVMRSGGLRRHASTRTGSHFLRAVFGCGAAASITWASARMPIADATAIGMLYGVITVGLGIAFLGERVGRLHWAAVALSCAGAVVVMGQQGAFQGTIPVWPASIALLSATLMAAEGLMIRVISQLETALSMMLHVTVFGMVLMLIPALLEWRSVGLEVTLACLLLGPLGVAAQYCTIRGYRMAPLSVVGPVDYSWLIFAILLGFFAFGEVPGLGVVFGGALIILGGLLLARAKTEAAPASPIRPGRRGG